MQIRNIHQLLATTAITVSSIFVAGQSAQAFDFRTPTSEWTYVNDSARDGTDGPLGGVGRSSDFEMFGMAFKEVGDEFFIGINSNLDITGQYTSSASDNNIGWGDLLINFTSENLQEASAQEKLFGIRFAPTNDSGVSETGVYSNVKGMNVTSTNSGWNKFNKYKNWVNNTSKDKLTDENGDVIDVGEKGEVGFGDLTVDEASEYLNPENKKRKTLNSIESGTKIGDITMLTELELETLAFYTDNDPEYSQAKTFGFKFDKNLLPEGEALLTLLQECINDGMAMKLNLDFEDVASGILSEGPTRVPEPGSIAALAFIGGGMFLSRRRKSK